MNNGIPPLGEQCALVTGGTSGVGAAAAIELAQRGVGRVIVAGRDSDRADDTCRQIRKAGSTADFVHAELEKHDSAASVMAQLGTLSTKVDILVNAAGVTHRASPTSATEHIYDELFAVNVRAPFFLTQRWAQDLISTGRSGAVVNVLSFAMYGGAPDIAVYAMTKAALGTFTRNAAYAWQEKGIRVNGINIGWTLTPGEDAVMRDAHGAPENWEELYAGSLPLGRLLRPAEIGHAIGYLATSDSAPMTGSIVDFDQSSYGVADWPPPRST